MDTYCRKCGRPLDSETGFCPNCEPDLVREARLHLPADDDETIFVQPQELITVRESAPEKWRQDILEDLSLQKADEEDTRTGSAYDGSRIDERRRQREKKKRKTLPVVLTAIVFFLIGAGVVHLFGSSGDDREDVTQTTSESSVENTTENATEGITVYPETEENLSLKWESYLYNPKSSFDKPYCTNQLIITKEDSVFSEEEKRIIEEKSWDVIAQNDYDRSLLIQCDGELTDDELKEKMYDLENMGFVQKTHLNYFLEDNRFTDVGENQYDEWNLEKTFAEELKRVTEDNYVRNPKVGLIQVRDINNGQEQEKGKEIIKRIVPSEEEIFVTSGFVDTTDTLYALTFQLTELLVDKGRDGENCQVLSCAVMLPEETTNNNLRGTTSAGDYLENSLEELDRKMRASSEKSSNIEYKCLICYSPDIMDHIQWSKMDCISGISVGAATITDGDIEKAHDIETGNCDVMAPGEGIPFYDGTYSGESLAVAHVAGFAANVLTMRPDKSAKDCGDIIRDGSNVGVKRTKVKMINGKRIANIITEDAE